MADNVYDHRSLMISNYSNPLERLTTKISSGSRLKVKFIEDKRLNVSYDNCKKFYFNN
jgi:hypothetical protein